MSYDEDDLKKVANTKEWLERKVNDLEIELNTLKQTLDVINRILRTSSFQPAKHIKQSNSQFEQAINQHSSQPITNNNNSYQKLCNKCKVEIEMRKVDEKWGAYIPNSNERHKCVNNE